MERRVFQRDWFFQSSEINLGQEEFAYKKWLLLSLGVHLLFSFFSSGFYHFDEHFQVTEFLSYKWGWTPESSLPWEFGHRMRSFAQPLFYHLFLYPLQVLGLKDPFIHATLMRIITAIIGWFSTLYLMRSVLFYFRSKWSMKNALIFSMFLWFIPYIHLRPSAESLGGSFFWIGFALFLNCTRERVTSKEFLKGFLVGLFWGFAFLFRFQVGVMVMFAWFWAVFFHRQKLALLIGSALAIIVCFLLSFPIDFWGYGEWTFSAYNYLDQNIFKNRIADQGATPWWEYFRTVFNRGVPPISIFVILGNLLFFFLFPKKPMTWALAPFLLFHFMISGKALRFFFPAAMATPFVIFMVVERLGKIKEGMDWPFANKWSQYFFKFLVGLNVLLLLQAGLRSSNVGVNFYRAFKDIKAEKIYANDENPFTMLGLTLHFYNPNLPQVEVIKNFDRFKELSSGSIGYYYANRGHKFFEVKEKYPQCQLVFLSYPEWILKYNIGNWVSRSRVWSLFKCDWR